MLPSQLLTKALANRERVEEMSTTRRFCCDDLLKFNNVNLDVLTETVRAFDESRTRHPRLFCFVQDSISCRYDNHDMLDAS